MKIHGMSVDAFWKGEARIQALVEDESATYRTKIFIKGSRLSDYSCSCAEENSRKGACEHCQALLQEFELRETEEKRPPVSTSREAREMLKKYTRREVARISEEETAGEPVSLLPCFVIRYGSVALECRIGGKRTFAVKNLLDFAHAVRTGGRMEYGKGTAFIHCMSAFSEKSRPLVSLVLEEAEAYVYHYEEIRGRGGYGLPAIRSLPLDQRARDRFFSIMEGEEVETEDYRGQIRRLRMVRKNPPFAVKVRKEGPEGISLSIPRRIMAFDGEEYFYVADEKCLYCCDREYADAMGIFLGELLSKEKSLLTGWEECTVTVHKRDIPLFYARILSRLEVLGLLDDEEISWEEYRLPELRARFDFDTNGPEEVVMTPALSYGTYCFQPVEEKEIPREICRDEPEEYRISCLITKYFQCREEESKRLVIRRDEDALYRLLSEGMERFREAGEVRLSDSFRSLRILPPPRISLGVSVNEGWLELDVDTGELSSGELAKLLSQYKRKKKYYRMKSGEFLTLPDEGLLALSRLSDGLGLEGDFPSKKLTLPAYRAFYIDSVMEECKATPFSRDQQFAAMIRELKSAESLKDVTEKPPGALEPVLREYQKTGFVWLRTLRRYGFGGILADDMGLGKTIQILALLASAYENGEAERPSLVVCPSSLIYNWSHECSVFAPSLRVLLATGDMEERKEALAAADRYDVILTSYELLRRDFSLYREQEFSFLILDEAQYIKNAATQNAKAVKAVKAAARFALTGTPVENRLAELWSIFDFLMPGFLFSYRKFRARFEVPIVKKESPEALKCLRRMIRPFVLRRLKSDVLKELPPKLEKVVYSLAEGRQDMLYRAEALQLKRRLEQTGAEELGRARLEILSQLTRLRQICCDPSLCYENYTGGSAKLETVVSLIFSAAESGHKLLLFSQFASMLQILKERLEGEGLSCHMLTGATPKEERNRLVNAFQEDGVPVFLISLKAGGTGLNLTAADIVIHYDPWWNAAVQNQATDRAHRIGQERQVTVYRMIMKNTIEENIMKLQESKRFLADQIVTEGMVSLGQLGREELLAILDGEGAE